MLLSFLGFLFQYLPCIFMQIVLFSIPGFSGSSGVCDSNGRMKTVTYGAKPDSGQAISLLCEKLIPLLERLELLSEVCCFPDYCLDLCNLIIPTLACAIVLPGAQALFVIRKYLRFV